MASYLTSDRVNVALLWEDARRLLVECLDRCHGTKAIFWDEKLAGNFGLIAEYSLLKEHNVPEMFQLKPRALPDVKAQNIIFIVRPNLSIIDIIVDIVQRLGKLKVKKMYHVLFVPRKTLLCERKLSQKEVLGNLNVMEYPVELFPVDSDVISMELDLSFKECCIENDFTTMYHTARALMTIQSLYGVIPNIYGKGKLAKRVFDLMTRMRRDMVGNEPQVSSQIDCLLLIDRSIDLLSVLATQLTFEGLLDEIYGIKNTIIKLPPEKFTKSNEGGLENINEPKTFVLNSSMKLFSELRDKNFNAVGPILSQKAKLLAARFDERHGAKTIGEIKQFVEKLPDMQAEKKELAINTSMAELVKEYIDSESFLTSLQIEQEFMSGIETDKVNSYIEDCIAKEEPLIKVLRLICMQSVTNNGLKQKVLEYYKREIIQTYGYEHVFTLNNLEKAGLLKVQGNKTYSTIRKTMKLVVEDVDELNPKDTAYVHSVYAPLSVRLAEFLVNPGWRAISDVLNILPGPTVEEVQDVSSRLYKRRGSGSSLQSSTEDKKVTLVFFLGGCTFAEISALRFLSKQEDSQMEYVIATTKLLNGRTFIESLQETLAPPS